MAPTTTTTRPRSHDRKRIKHSTIMPIQDYSHRRSSFRYSSINNSGTSLNSILEVDQGDRREEAATCTTASSSSRLSSSSSSTPLTFTVTQSPPPTGIAHTDFWHSTRTMKKTQPCTSLSGLLDIVSMENDDDDEEEEIDEDFDKDHKKMDGVDDDDIHNTVSVTSSIRDSSISSFSSSSNNSQEEADGDGYFFFEEDANNDYENDENCEWGLQF